MAMTEPAGFGGLSLVKKDGSHSQRFPLVERRYLFGRCGLVHFSVGKHDSRSAGSKRGVTVRWPFGQGPRRAIHVLDTVLCDRGVRPAWSGHGIRPCCDLCNPVLDHRADYCHIRINLLNVSREHAEIVVDEKDQVCSARVPFAVLGGPGRSTWIHCGISDGVVMILHLQLGAAGIVMQGNACIYWCPSAGVG